MLGRLSTILLRDMGSARSSGEDFRGGVLDSEGKPEFNVGKPESNEGKPEPCDRRSPEFEDVDGPGK